MDRWVGGWVGWVDGEQVHHPTLRMMRMHAWMRSAARVSRTWRGSSSRSILRRAASACSRLRVPLLGLGLGLGLGSGLGLGLGSGSVVSGKGQG